MPGMILGPGKLPGGESCTGLSGLCWLVPAKKIKMNIFIKSASIGMLRLLRAINKLVKNVLFIDFMFDMKIMCK